MKFNTVKEVRIILEKVREMDYKNTPRRMTKMSLPPNGGVYAPGPLDLIKSLENRKKVILELRKHLEDEGVSYFCTEALWELGDRDYLLNFIKKTKQTIQLKILSNIHLDNKTDEELIKNIKKTLDELDKNEDSAIKDKINQLHSEIKKFEYDRLEEKTLDRYNKTTIPSLPVTTPEPKTLQYGKQQELQKIVKDRQFPENEKSGIEKEQHYKDINSENETKKSKGESLLKLVPLISLIALIAFNFLIHPIIGPPRISTVDIECPYVQSEIAQSINYYKVCQVTYTIKPAFIPIFLSTELIIPGDHDRTNGVEWNTGRREINPDIEINLPREKLEKNFLSVKDIQGRIPIIVRSNFKVESIKQSIEIREYIRVTERTFWWSDSSIKPNLQVSIDRYSQFVGCLLGEISNKTYSVDELRLKNTGDIKFLDYNEKFASWVDKVCYDGKELDLYGNNNNTYFISSLELSPGDEKILILIYERPPEDPCKKEYIKGNLSRMVCFEAWNAYKKFSKSD